MTLAVMPSRKENASVTPWTMAVAVVVVVAYLGARSLRSARTLGWFLVPLGAVAVIGLWTPLALGLVPMLAISAVTRTPLPARRSWAPLFIAAVLMTSVPWRRFAFGEVAVQVQAGEGVSHGWRG